MASAYPTPTIWNNTILLMSTFSSWSIQMTASYHALYKIAKTEWISFHNHYKLKYHNVMQCKIHNASFQIHSIPFHKHNTYKSECVHRHTCRMIHKTIHLSVYTASTPLCQGRQIHLTRHMPLNKNHQYPLAISWSNLHSYNTHWLWHVCIAKKNIFKLGQITWGCLQNHHQSH